VGHRIKEFFKIVKQLNLFATFCPGRCVSTIEQDPEILTQTKTLNVMFAHNVRVRVALTKFTPRLLSSAQMSG
jgi:hypothetical protein